MVNIILLNKLNKSYKLNKYIIVESKLDILKIILFYYYYYDVFTMTQKWVGKDNKL